MKSEIKKLSAEIERLQKENELKSGWISLLSHDFKEVFGSLIWLTEAVESETIAKDDFFKLLPRIHQDAKKNLQTVTDTNEWFKTQMNGFKPEKSNLLALDLFIKLKTKFEKKLAAKKINFQFQGDESLVFKTDPFLIFAILEKLLDNAIKYSHRDKPIHFEAFRTKNTTTLSIIDFGAGMELEIQESLFTFRSPVFKGTNGEIGAGLGLNIVRNFVSLMQGKIEIDSTHNVGTKITVILP
ncbi:sensor histidine kinase [Aequorivita capsosiphonis]|uniref:sensor histidine kinase n=1 Tax=Aequorivita capsosiphonis TaxID=487317 RepID=UPI0004274A02|nr:HAMP domain-containing sensor histidine kinase [Aequorivita capsosiphonis]